MTASSDRPRPRLIAALLAALCVIGAPLHAFADDHATDATAEVDPASSDEGEDYEIDAYQIGATTLDVLVLRPLGAATVVGGFVFFVASVPFVAPSGGIVDTWDTFVYSSYDLAVLRPLGELF